MLYQYTSVNDVNTAKSWRGAIWADNLDDWLTQAGSSQSTTAVTLTKEPAALSIRFHVVRSARQAASTACIALIALSIDSTESPRQAAKPPTPLNEGMRIFYSIAPINMICASYGVLTVRSYGVRGGRNLGERVFTLPHALEAWFLRASNVVEAGIVNMQI